MRWFGISFSEGNRKTGDVLSFSLPSKETCPGKSVWCEGKCYSYRYERIRPTCRAAYSDNLVMARNPEQFAETMIGVLPRILRCFRIHVGGDFWSVEYVEAWKKICASFPQTRFWAYTRSWRDPELKAALESLRDLPNTQIFASVDPSMTPPPKGWRTAFLDMDPRATGKRCAHQTGLKESCLHCGYCFEEKAGHVIFKAH